MKTFEVVVRDECFKVDLTGYFEAETQDAAEELAREEFAMDLDTSPEDIEIVSIKEV